MWALSITPQAVVGFGLLEGDAPMILVILLETANSIHLGWKFPLFQTVGSLVDFISGGCQATDSEDKGVALHHVCPLFQLLEEEEGGGRGNLATWMEWRFPVARP